MIDKDLLTEIKPKTLSVVSSVAHIATGLPVDKVLRLKHSSPEEWEVFVEEWACSLENVYSKVRRLGGSGDFGVDIVGFCTDEGFEGQWDNYQCKRYQKALTPSDILVELGKVIYYSFIGEYTPPRRCYFVAPLGIGTMLERLLNKPTELRNKLIDNWDTHCKKGITATKNIELEGDFLSYVKGFDFKIFSSKSSIELIDAHSHTRFHSLRFGGGLPQRLTPEVPPTVIASESRYIRQILDAYGEHLKKKLADVDSLSTHQLLQKDLYRQRERFYHAEGLRNFSRDTVPEGTFQSLQQEIYHGVVDVVESTHQNGYERMKAVLNQATTIGLISNPLTVVLKLQDRQGICHQLANDDAFSWVINDD